MGEWVIEQLRNIAAKLKVLMEFSKNVLSDTKLLVPLFVALATSSLMIVGHQYWGSFAIMIPLVVLTSAAGYFLGGGLDTIRTLFMKSFTVNGQQLLEIDEAVEERVVDSLMQMRPYFPDGITVDLGAYSEFASKTAGFIIRNALDQNAIQEMVSSNFEKTKSLITDVENKMSDANSSSVQAKENADIGNQKMLQLSQSIKSFEGIESLMTQLQEVFKDLNTKMSRIDGIVFTSRLLSFNAAIEAARAGEHGRTFSVVSHEMSKLASEIGKLSNEIQEILVQSEGEVTSVQNSVLSSVHECEACVSDSQESFASVIENIFQLTDKIKSVSESFLNYNSTSKEVGVILNKITQASSSLGMAAANTRSISVNLKEMQEKVKAHSNLSADEIGVSSPSNRDSSEIESEIAVA